MVRGSFCVRGSTNSQMSVKAAFQVGLSYLSVGMRRAVSACTSPEVFFGNTAALQTTTNPPNTTADPLSLAMDTLYLNDPRAPSPISPAY